MRSLRHRKSPHNIDQNPPSGTVSVCGGAGFCLITWVCIPPASSVLGVNFFLELVQIYPALCLLLQPGLQFRLLCLEFLELHIVAAAGLLGCRTRRQLRFQLRQRVVDGLKLQLLLIGEFQLPLPGAFRRAFGTLCPLRYGLLPRLAAQSDQLPV